MIPLTLRAKDSCFCGFGLANRADRRYHIPFIYLFALYLQAIAMDMKTDVIVVGAGHAGCEAALAAARLGSKVVLITLHLDTVAQLSCNPAIGGLAKGQLVREIDALGGAMGLCTDATGIQFRILNASKGPAVQSPRAQADKKAYQFWMKHYIEKTENIQLLMDEVVEILTDGDNLTGIKTALGLKIKADAVVLTTGTFLKGIIHIGKWISEGGRCNEKSANELSGCLKKLGFPVARLKTGTPARVNADFIDYSLTEEQPGDENPKPFSYLNESLSIEQMCCHTVHTNEETHKIVQEALADSPLFSGQIQGIGPRYCPSFELKVHRFPDRTRHLVHLEPEGRNTKEVYINGMSTSLNYEVQEKMIKSVPALKNSKIMRYGYAVEYDYVPPRELRPTLETKRIHGLFHAGQINGTSGYEEAGAQGLIAGVNAALLSQKRPPFVLDRSQAYIGVLIDDLITKGTDEPYRLFTSRAEYRLLLRSDNADIRLSPLAADIGLVSEERREKINAIKDEINKTLEYIRKVFHNGSSLEKLLRQPEMNYESISAIDPQNIIGDISARAKEQIEIMTKYEGYISRQLGEIEKYKKTKSQKIPENFDYNKLSGLRCEAKEKLIAFRPGDLEDAGRISGVSPADVAIIAVHLKRLGRVNSKPEKGVNV